MLLPAGRYRCDGVLTVERSGVVVRGAGPEATFVFFTRAKGLGYAAHLTLRGKLTAAPPLALATDGAAASRVVEVGDASSLAPGDDVSIGWTISPAFIADADAPTLPRAAFCHDLARLELTISQVFDAKETPPLSPARIAAVAAADWERARLSPVAAHCLLELRYNVNAYLQSVRDQSPTAPRPRRKDSFVLIYRRDYRVYRLELGRPARDLLTALFAGTPLGEAIARTCQHGDRPPSQNQLFRWFRDWVANGIFSSLTIG